MTRLQLLVAIALVSFIIVFQDEFVTFLSGDPASLTLLGLSLILLAHQLRRRFIKTGGPRTLSH